MRGCPGEIIHQLSNLKLCTVLMSSCSQVEEECLEVVEERAWHHLFFLPDSPGDNVGYICSCGCVTRTSDDFLKSGICVKAKW